MKPRRRITKTLLALALVALLPCFPAAAAPDPSATIAIDASRTGPRLSPSMYGIFLEEINHGVDGGLYAEMVRNRGFEDARPPEGYLFQNGRWVDSVDRRAYDAGFSRFGYFTNGLPFWSLIKDGAADGSMFLDLESPLNESSPRSLRLEIRNASSGRIGIANEGFWGIGVQRGDQYELSFWARAAKGFSGPLAAVLESTDGSPCSEPKIIKGIGPAWKQFHVRLIATKTDARARLALTARSPGTVWFDLVSLFPARTFKGRPNGLRMDIAQMIADLKPGFVRFPGGCVVEGGTIETAYNWKDTVGPIEQRREVWGPWNYRRTHGLGFHEYLQFCEDLNSEPLYVGFAGETCMFRHAEDVPIAEMGWVTSNFLDAIEYANGGTGTKWGRLRAAQGHSRSFKLKLVEVGNENGTRNFPERYRLVHSALKAKYPELSYIADLSFGANFMRQESFDMEDNHFYNSPQWFMNNVHHYDLRDRKLAPVYDGEVAVTSGEGGRDKGNVIAALGEGAFLMGLEHNADVVRMVSYAPLLANVRGRTDWHGMIYFDTTRVFGTVSYYLWKLFAENRPDYTVPAEIQFSAPPGNITGAIGIGTWGTAAEFKDIRVEQDGKTLFVSDFSSSDAGWRKEGGNWSVADGVYRQSQDANGLSCFGDESWSNYVITLKARKLHGAEGFLVVFGRKAEDRYWWNVGGWGNTQHAIEMNQSPVGRPVRGQLETERWYDLKVEVNGRRIRCYLDGALVHDETAPAPHRLFVNAGREEANGELIIKAINPSSRPLTAALNLSGVNRVMPEARITTLRSAQPVDNNSLENPTRIVPVEGRLKDVGKQFEHEFPPYSFTVLRLKVK